MPSEFPERSAFCCGRCLLFPFRHARPSHKLCGGRAVFYVLSRSVSCAESALICEQFVRKSDDLACVLLFAGIQNPAIEKVIDEYMITFTDKALKQLTQSVKDSLEENGMMIKSEAGLLNKRQILVPSKEARTGVIEKIRAELLEEGEITEDVVILTVLLDQADCLKEYFSKYEQKELKGKLKEIRESSWGQRAKKMTEHIEMLIACIIATGAAAH